MFKKILIGLVVVIALILGYAATRPSEFRVERSIAIAAPAAAVFPHVNDLKAWQAWSPWQKLDPNMTQTYEGPASGVGAVSAWAGNSKVGEGKSTIVESRPEELVRIQLDMLKPMKASNQVDFTFQPQGEQTLVTWAMSGNKPFIGKVFGLFMDMDQMIGKDFETGLAGLKSVAEAGAAPAETAAPAEKK